MAPSIKDLARLVNGVALIAKEVVRHSETLKTAQSGDFQALFKKAVASAADITGLTRGRVREFSRNPIGRSKESVVFFTDSDAGHGAASSEPGAPVLSTPVNDDPRHVSDPEAASSGVSEGLADPSTDVSSSSGDGQGVSHLGNLKRDDELCKERGEGKEVNGALAESPVNEGAKKISDAPVKRRKPRERRVPSTPFSRTIGFAGLGAGLAWGTVQESARRLVFGTPDSQEKHSAVSPFLSEKNAERLALALCRMRGAALKLGQMLSIQDETLVPAPILAALDVVRQGADVMPRSQLNQVLDSELGSDWTRKLTSFDYEPMAAASIGQVHRAVTKDGLQVAMKIQYPGVADSIESDIENVKLLLDYTNLIPKGLHLDRAMKSKIGLFIFFPQLKTDVTLV